MRDWLKLGSVRATAESVIAEAIRRMLLVIKNDPNAIPQADDASNILAARRYAQPPVIPATLPDDVNAMLAARIYAHSLASAIAGGTPLNIPWTLALRDALGDFAMRRLTLDVLIGRAGASYDLQLWAPDLAAILRTPTGTHDVELPGGSLKVNTGFGCNSKAAQAAVTIGGAATATGGSAAGAAGAASATYDAPTQTAINNALATTAADATIINGLVADVAVLVARVNTMRTALIANGILV